MHMSRENLGSSFDAHTHPIPAGKHVRLGAHLPRMQVGVLLRSERVDFDSHAREFEAGDFTSISIGTR